MYTVGILVLSDKGARGEREDLSGTAIIEALPRDKFSIVYREMISDDFSEICKALRYICDEIRPNLLLTSGGTGFSKRDNTPEATQAVMEKSAPGIAEAIRFFGMQKTPKAMLSRAVAGMRADTLMINLPGSVRGVVESLAIVFPVLDHALDILSGKAGECGNDQFRK